MRVVRGISVVRGGKISLSHHRGGVNLPPCPDHADSRAIWGGSGGIAATRAEIWRDRAQSHTFA